MARIPFGRRRSIRVRVLIDEAGQRAGFDASGHALFGAHGTDVVCAAVSVLLQTAIIGLEQAAGASPSWSKASGRLHCEVSPLHSASEGVRVLLDSVLLGLRNIEAQYPRHLRIEEKPLRSRSGVAAPQEQRAAPQRSPAQQEILEED